MFSDETLTLLVDLNSPVSVTCHNENGQDRTDRYMSEFQTTFMSDAESNI